MDGLVHIVALLLSLLLFGVPARRDRPDDDDTLFTRGRRTTAGDRIPTPGPRRYAVSASMPR